MTGTTKEYRYSVAVRRRGIVLSGLGLVLMLGLLGVVTLRWADLSIGTRSIAAVLFIALLFTIRGQLARAVFRCLLEPEVLRIVAPLSGRNIPWNLISEVRRMNLPQVGGRARWACTLLVRTTNSSAMPVFAFDDQLEHAEEALEDVIRRTPQARHVIL